MNVENTAHKETSEDLYAEEANKVYIETCLMKCQ